MKCKILNRRSISSLYWGVLLVLVSTACSEPEANTSFNTPKPVSNDQLKNEPADRNTEVREVKEPKQLAVGEALSRKSILKGRVEFLLPKGFKEMGYEMVRQRYPLEGHRPTQVYTNEAGTVNVAFNYTANKATIEELPKVKEALEMQMTPPTWEVLHSEIRNVNGQPFFLRKFLSPSESGKIFNYMFVTTLDNRLLMGTFNCPEKDRAQWEAMGEAIIHSLRLLE